MVGKIKRKVVKPSKAAGKGASAHSAQGDGFDFGALVTAIR
jgi:hypothetical protein